MANPKVTYDDATPPVLESKTTGTGTQVGLWQKYNFSTVSTQFTKFVAKGTKSSDLLGMFCYNTNAATAENYFGFKNIFINS